MILRYIKRLQITLALATSLILASCGGGGGGGTSTPAATITGINPVGLIAATPRSLSITGTNFSSGMTLDITTPSGTTTSITPTSVTSTLIVANNFSISTAPPERYVTVSIKSGNTTVAFTTLGVASTSVTLSTDIQTQIFDAYCIACHGASGNLDLSSTTLPSGNTASAANLIETNSTGCSQKLRVKAGDPRRSNNVLLDVLQNGPVMSCNSITVRYMPQSQARLSPADINKITDWIAGGAH